MAPKLLTVAALACFASGCIVDDIHKEMKTTNQSMALLRQDIAVLQKQLSTLESIDTSLKNLDVHLASLRETLKAFDEKTPGDLKTDDATTQPATRP